MQRINLGKPYEEFILRLVQAGHYSSASEVLKDALRLKMEHSKLWQGQRLQQLVQEGLDDVEAGRVVPYSKDLLNRAFEQAKEIALLKKKRQT